MDPPLIVLHFTDDRPPPPISLRVLRDGRPVPGAIIRPHDRSSFDLDDPDGSQRPGDLVTDGDGRAQYQLNGFDSVVFDVIAGGLRVAHEVLPVLREGQAAVRVDLAAPAPELHRPPVAVELSVRGKAVEERPSDGLGVAVQDAGPGGLSVRSMPVQKSDEGPTPGYWIVEPIVTRAGELQTVTLPHPGSQARWVRLRVRADGRPAAGARLVFQPQSGHRAAHAIADGDGVARFFASPGYYRLIVNGAGALAGAAPAIEATGLRKVFRTRRKTAGLGGSWAALWRPAYTETDAVAGIDLRVEAGESVAFIGPNGAGKSTTIKLLTGILHPTAGEATVLGCVPWRDRERLAYRIGSVFGQKSQLWYHLPPIDTFNLLSHIYDLEPAAYRAQRDLLVEAFELRDLLHQPVRKLSLGQRMRCEIAASLLHRPAAVFLDEPTIGLDVVAKQKIRELMRRWNREEGVTIFLTSHDAGDVEQVCKRAIVINHGRILFDGAVSALRRRYLRHKIVGLRLGTPFTGLDMPGVTVLKVGEQGLGVKLRVQSPATAEPHATAEPQAPSAGGAAQPTPIDELIAAILRRYPVLDITIEDPPMEEIIAAMYREASVPEAMGGGA